MKRENISLCKSTTYVSIFGVLMWDNDDFFPKEIEGIYLQNFMEINEPSFLVNEE